MKKAKNAFVIIGIVLSVIAAALLLLHPVIDGIAAGMTEGASPAMAFKDYFGLVIERVKAVVDFSWITNFSIDALKINYPMIVAAVGAILLIVLFILMLCKKHAKGLGWWFPMLILFAVAIVVASVYIKPDNFYNAYVAKGTFVVDPLTKILFIVGLVCALAAAGAFILGSIFYMAYVCKARKAAKKAAAEAVVAEEAAPADAAAAPAAEAAPEAVAVEAPADAAAAPAAPAADEVPAEENAKVIRRILVHKSGKVVRVLNEHYYDITTNVFVDQGYYDPNRPAETEQQHYERLINEAKNVLQPAAAPVAQPAPAPAPVIVVTQPQPQVVVAPAPAVVAAPAPVVAPAPAVVAAPVAKPKVERISFTDRLKHSEKALKLAYNEIKSEILSYGLKSRVSIAGDTFRLHTKTYIMLVVAGKSLKLYFALNPKDYKDSTFPLGDASKKVLHKDTPLVFKVKSDLSVRRCKTLIADVCAKDGLDKGEFIKHDHVKDLKA